MKTAHTYKPHMILSKLDFPEAWDVLESVRWYLPDTLGTGTTFLWSFPVQVAMAIHSLNLAFPPVLHWRQEPGL